MAPQGRDRHTGTSAVDAYDARHRPLPQRLTLGQALTDLRRLAEIDLNDHFRFVYTGHDTSIGGDEQPNTDGYRVAFDVYIGARKKSTVYVDLAIGAGLTAPVSTVEPASALSLPRLVSSEYRLYPVVDQTADKVCATMKTYGDRPSSREKDLVDLVVIAVTQDIDGTALSRSISAEARHRQMEPFDHFVVPDTWGRGYARLAKPVPYCADFPTIDQARELVTHFIDPALDGSANQKTWSHETRSWN